MAYVGVAANPFGVSTEAEDGEGVHRSGERLAEETGLTSDSRFWTKIVLTDGRIFLVAVGTARWDGDRLRFTDAATGRRMSTRRVGQAFTGGTMVSYRWLFRELADTLSRCDRRMLEGGHVEGFEAPGWEPTTSTPQYDPAGRPRIWYLVGGEVPWFELPREERREARKAQSRRKRPGRRVMQVLDHSTCDHGTTIAELRECHHERQERARHADCPHPADKGYRKGCVMRAARDRKKAG